MKSYPLVLSMTNFQQAKRCRKQFELSTIRELTPRRDTEAAADGRAFHEILAHAAMTGALPETHENPDMLDVAKEYVAARPLPSNIVAAERGYFAQVAPNVYIRASFDLVYIDETVRGGQVVIRDYKTFRKAPSGDVDLDFQGRAYLFVAEQALGAKDARFEWHYVRQELGRFLSGGKGKDAVWTPWGEDERYLLPSTLEMSELERETTRREMYDTALDIVEFIERGRYYRTELKGGGYDSCDRCFYKDLCKADWFGNLDEQTIALLTMPTDLSERVMPETMAEDPRVLWHMSEQDFTTSQAIAAVYGQTGQKKYEEALTAA